MERRLHIMAGQVQGVGFRPFVYRTALSHGLTGSVGNTPEGVRIEVQGEPERLAAFRRGLDTQAPPLARIVSHKESGLPVVPEETAFVIRQSEQGGHGGHHVLISPDMAVCDACLADTLNPTDRRHGYAFTNCTDCGPRYSITRSIPYDRPFTSMACFPLCPDCRAEYENPLDRRFHAQPNACPVCGPEVWLEYGPGCPPEWKAVPDVAPRGPGSEPAESLQAEDMHPDNVWPHGEGGRSGFRGHRAVAELLAFFRQGGIAAVKGLGGFHLACDAFHADAVATLRLRKNRPHKALAVMVADMSAARALADISPEAEDALLSPRRPIVICPRKPGVLPSVLAPDTASIGLTLPSTPLQHLFFHPEACGAASDLAPRALVMTSGNTGGEPICLGNREAREKLGGIADAFLFHNRDILVRVDDSVLFPVPAGMIRRARGFVPEPLPLPKGGAVIQPLRDVPAQALVHPQKEEPGMAVVGELPERDVPSPLHNGTFPAVNGRSGMLGFEPSPLHNGTLPAVLAVGAELKHTFCLTRGREAFVSQHIGDLSHSGPLAFFEETLAHLLALLEVKPAAVVRDLHPDYLSSRVAEDFARRRNLPVLTLQHHYAHIHAVLAEHGSVGPALGLALDGSGLGDDGSIWGGELLLVRPGAADGVPGEKSRVPDGAGCVPGEKGCASDGENGFRVGEGGVAGGMGGADAPGGMGGADAPGEMGGADAPGEMEGTDTPGGPGNGHASGWIHQRLGRFTPFALPGGEAAIRSPWRVAESLWRQAGLPQDGKPWARDEARAAMLPVLGQMLEKSVNSPLTSSCGRLFDAVAAVCGLCFDVSYEGQAAVLLEEAQDRRETGAYPVSLLPGPLPSGEMAAGACVAPRFSLPSFWTLDAVALFRAAAEDRRAGTSVGRVSRRFHLGLAQGLADWAETAALATGVRTVALAGGVLHNRTLAAELPDLLRARGLSPLLPVAYPPGDGAIALGQAAWASRL